MQVHYSHPDQGDDPQPDPFKHADLALCREIGGWLKKNMPRHHQFFTAWVSHAQGVAIVRMPMLTGGTNGYILHIGVLQIGPTAFHNCMRDATGELLERFRLSRGKGFDDDAFVQAVKSIPRVGLDQRPIPV